MAATGERTFSPVPVAGLGLVSPLGDDPGSLAAALAAGRTAPGAAAEFDLAALVPGVQGYLDRASALALAAGARALAAAGLEPDEAELEKRGVVTATAWGCLESLDRYAKKLEASGPKFAPPFLFTHAYANAPASFLAIHFRLGGHHGCWVDGWNSGTEAVLDAAAAIQSGRAETVLVVGVEALSEPRRARFAPGGERAGQTPGEAAAALVLAAGGEKAEKPPGFIRGGAEAGDPESAAARAVARAGLEAKDLSLVAWPGHQPLPEAIRRAYPAARFLELAPLGGDLEGASGVAQILTILALIGAAPRAPGGAGLSLTWNPEGGAGAVVAGR